jgi:hypothetical protein
MLLLLLLPVLGDVLTGPTPSYSCSPVLVGCEQAPPPLLSVLGGCVNMPQFLSSTCSPGLLDLRGASCVPLCLSMCCVRRTPCYRSFGGFGVCLCVPLCLARCAVYAASHAPAPLVDLVLLDVLCSFGIFVSWRSCGALAHSSSRLLWR